MNNSLINPEKREKETGGQGRAVLWGALVALAVGNVFAIWQSGQTQTQIDELTNALQSRITTVEKQTNAVGTSAGQAAAKLKDDVEETRQAAKEAADLAKKAAEKHAVQLVNKLTNTYQSQHMAMTSEIGQVKSSATQANQGVISVKTDVATVRGDVATVRGDVVSTRTDLDETRNELTSMQGDLGVQSGLIATNSRQLEALRELGERSYYEFQLPKNNDAHKVGHIAIVVKNTKPKRGKFTMDVIADDQRVEKKNRTINEPVQFYVSSSRQPYEIVVNEVHKDRIVGYLAVPKVLRAAR